VKTDFYRVLQVHPEADQQTIQAAYRSLSRRMHPDKNQDRREWAEQRTQALNEAYSVLGDVQRRLAFDREREDALQTGPSAGRRPMAGPMGGRPPTGGARVSEAGEYSASVANLRRLEEELFRAKQENHTLRMQCEELAAQVASREKELVATRTRLTDSDARRRRIEQSLGVAEKQRDILRGKLDEDTRAESTQTETRAPERPAASTSRPPRAQARAASTASRGPRTIELPGGQLTMPFVSIPGGSFRMGSVHGDAPEQPVHEVHVDAFRMSATLVTGKQFTAFLRAQPRWSKRAASPGRHADYLREFQGDTPPRGRESAPVTHIGWMAAAAFCEWAGCALPTEAQWECAAQGGEAHGYGTRNGTLHSRLANYGGTAGSVTDVRKHPANPFGLYDMAGNAWEWCADEYDAEFYASDAASETNPFCGAPVAFRDGDWADADPSIRRVIRGGSWQSLSADVRVAARASQTASLPSGFCGFRCVLAEG
jgi:formylglycine-generating enzyme required for sulfatase activity